MEKPAPQTWLCRDFLFPWGNRTLIMGIVNVTPDSFSDGGQLQSPSHAIDHACQMIKDGADIIDVGGESTRPGAATVSTEEEQKRVIPVIKELAEHRNLPVSIDTTNYNTALAAIHAGACVINDISGLQREPRMANLAHESKSGLIIMHMRGTPQTMQSNTDYNDLVSEVHAFLTQQTDYALQQGVSMSQLCIDPGIGFSKTAEQNLTLINQLKKIRIKNIPILLGASRKSFLGNITGETDPQKRISSTIAAHTLGIHNGADIIRVHDVKSAREAADTAHAILQETVHF